MAKINTVLFDFDGTIMDTYEVIISSWQHTFKTIDGKERPVSEILKTIGEPLDYTIANLYPAADVGEVLEIYRSYHRDNFGERIKLFPGMKELLCSLKDKGYKLGLVTSRLTNTTMEGLEKYEIKEYFDVVITADDTTKHKPDPEPINTALEKLGACLDESIMVGDTNYDILCAKNAGVKSVLVGWALTAPEHTPDHVIEKAEDLFEIL